MSVSVYLYTSLGFYLPKGFEDFSFFEEKIEKLKINKDLPDDWKFDPSTGKSNWDEKTHIERKYPEIDKFYFIEKIDGSDFVSSVVWKKITFQCMDYFLDDPDEYDEGELDGLPDSSFYELELSGDYSSIRVSLDYEDGDFSMSADRKSLITAFQLMEEMHRDFEKIIPGADYPEIVGYSRVSY